MTTKRYISFLLTWVMTVGLLPLTIPAVSAKPLAAELEHSAAVTIQGSTASGLKYEIYFNRVEITDYDSDNPKVIIPAEIEGLPVTSIGEYAFAYCPHLKSVFIPDSVTSIGSNAFSDCSGLTSINIPDGITAIRSGTFLGCSGLTRISLPDGVASIGSYAFRGCSGLGSIAIPESVISIGDRAFGGCSRLTEIRVAENNPKFSGDDRGVLFDKNKTKLIQAPGAIADSYTVPDGVTTIGKAAFEDCSGLPGIDIPGSVTGIGDDAFSACSGLTGIAFLGDAPEFGEGVFHGVTAEACYPAGNTGWTAEVMQDYGGRITWLAVDEPVGLQIVSAPGSGIVGQTPDLSLLRVELVYANGQHVTADPAKLTVGPIDVQTPGKKTVTVSCGGLSASFTYGVHEGTPGMIMDASLYPESTHNYKDSLDETQTLTWPGAEGLVLVFSRDTRVERDWDWIYVYDGADTLIASYTGTEAAGVKVKVPGDTAKIRLTSDYSVTFFGYAFDSIATEGTVVHTGTDTLPAVAAECTKTGRTEGFLCEICDEEQYTVIPALGHSYHAAVTKEATLTEPGVRTYTCTVCGNSYTEAIPAILRYTVHSDHVEITGCTGNPTEVAIPAEIAGLPVTSIGSGAFAWCSTLTRAEIPDSITSIGSGAFNGCAGLTGIHVEEHNPNYSGDARGVLFDKEKTQLIQAPGAIEGSYAIPEGVTSIGDHAFHGCAGLTGIHIPDSVTSMGESAFAQCSGLTEIEIPENMTVISQYAFDGCSGLVSIHIPAGVTAIGDYAFRSCPSLRGIGIPDSVTSIGVRALLGCTGLTTIEIPDSVTTIATRAFENCLGLKTIRFNGDAPKFGYYVFYNVTATAYYPVGNPTWTSGAMKAEFGKITWVAYTPSRTKLKITRQPTDVRVTGGEAATVSVSAAGDDLSYQWYFRNAGDSQFYPTASFTGDTYSVIMNADRAGRQVYCVITDRYGSSVTTDTVTLSMYTPLKITGQPTGVTVARGEIAKITVTAVGDGLSYKWYFRNAGERQFYLTSSFTGNTYSVTMDDSRNGRQVYCVIRDQYGNVEATTTVTLQMAPSVTITQQPVSVMVPEGKPAVVSVKATGEDLRYKWYFRDAGVSQFHLTGSFTGDIYQVQMNSARDGREIFCIITDRYGCSARTDVVTIRMGTPLAITRQPANVKVDRGKTATVSVDAIGEGLTYKWYFKNAGDSKFYLTNSFRGNTYSVTMDDSRAGRQVYCVITDKHGGSVTTNTVTLNMVKPLTITRQPVSRTVSPGGIANASVYVSGESQNGTFHYTWYVMDVGAKTWSVSGERSSTYGYSMTPAKSGRHAYCVVRDGKGNAVTSDIVTFNMKCGAAITLQPVSVSVADGEAATVSLNAAGEGLRYRWYFKNAGDSKFYLTTTFTGNVYSVTMDDSRDGRQVYCAVTDAEGNTVATEIVTLRKK